MTERLPTVGSRWIDADMRTTFRVLLLVPGAARPILLQRDGLPTDCESRLSLDEEAFWGCFKPLAVSA